MADLVFNKVYVTTIAANSYVDFTVTSGTVWKIESVGIGGTKGSVYLKIGSNNVAILFSTIQDNDYGSKLPFWMDDSVAGRFVNDSTNPACISISEWNT